MKRENRIGLKPILTGLHVRMVLSLAAIIVLSCAFTPAASAAFYTHPFISEVGPDGTSNTKFQRSGYVAVDQPSGDVLAADLDAGRVYRFDSSGAAHNFTEGEATGRNWLAVSALPYEITGIAVAPLGAPGGTAGDIYVSWAGRSSKAPGPFSWGVEILSPEGAHLGTLDGSGNPHHFPTESFETAHPCGIAVDPAGNLYVSNCATGSEPSHTDKYVPSSDPVTDSDFDSEIVGTKIPLRAASASRLYGNGRSFSLSLFPGGGGSAPSGEGSPSAGSESLAFDNSRGSLYAAEEVPFQIGAASIFFRGALELNEAGEAVSFTRSPLTIAGIGVDESSDKLYLTTNDKKIRINGPRVIVNPPTANLEPPSSVTFKSAHLSGTVNPGGVNAAEATIYRFECKPACGLPTGYTEIPADGASHEVSVGLEGLTPETSYEIRLVAINAYGHQKVVDEASFETAPKPPVTAPQATIDLPSEVTAESAHLSGTVDPMGSGEGYATTYRFEYTADGVMWTSLPTQGPIEGSGPQSVSTELEGLEPNTTYSVRLRAENDGGSDVSDEPNPSFTTEAVLPEAEISPATNVLAGSAQLNARVNPRNAQTTYWFEWGTGDCATATCASLPASQDGDAGSGGAFVSLHAQLEGLSPNTTYHYRLIAESSAGKVTTSGAAFTTGVGATPCGNQQIGLSAALPDCRAYEMVSPLEKAGGDVASLTFRTRAAADGDAVTFVSQAAFAGTDGFPYSGAEYLSSRSSAGWSTHSITPLKKSPSLPILFSGSEYVGFMSPDLDSGVYRGLAPNPDSSPNVEGADNLFLATGMRSGAPKFTLLSDSVNPLGVEPYASGGPDIAFVDASSDFKVVAFEDRDNLTVDASGTDPKLYEWSDGEVRLAGILPDSACGTPPCPAAQSIGGAGAEANGWSRFGTNTQIAHAVSDDGSKVFFTAGSLSPAGGDIGLEGSLYVREDGIQTTQIDVSERSEPDPKGAGRSEFQWATPDGSEVLFFSREDLVDEDTDGEGASLYRWKENVPAGERLTLIPTPGALPLHIIDASLDGTFVYLLGTPDRTIYALHDGQMRKVAELAGLDPEVGESGIELNDSQARMTPDGRHLLFHSHRELTGYEQRSPACGSPGFHEEECTELYLYSYDADELVCVSCNPSGDPPTGDVPIFTRPILNAGVEGNASPYLNAPISTGGRYVFFTSPDPLVAKDSNGRYDAYVYDVPKREVRLLSSGQCNCESVFMTASPSGRDAFFTTRQQLVRADVDNLVDLYDARVGGGIASQNALPPAECQGDACQAPPVPPNDPTPASSTFSGPGNPVAQPPMKKQKKHKKRKHRKKKRASKGSKRTSNPERRVGK